LWTLGTLSTRWTLRAGVCVFSILAGYAGWSLRTNLLRVTRARLPLALSVEKEQVAGCEDETGRTGASVIDAVPVFEGINDELERATWATDLNAHDYTFLKC
jgi:hypothetical protein